MTTLPMVRPFSCGSQYGDWTAANCERCVKAADPDDPPARCPCDIEQALLEAYMGDGTVTAEIAERMGFEGPTARYVWRCREWGPPEAWKAEWRERHGGSR